MDRLQCKRCEMDYVRQSHRRGTLEWVLGTTMGMYPFRCQLCAYRFWVMRRNKPDRASFVNDDKRDYQRIQVRFPVTFVGDQHSGMGTVTNLSIRGCSMESTARPHHNAILSLKLYQSESLPPIEIETGIVRSALGKRFGIEFLEMDPTEEERLRSHVEGLIATRPNELRKVFLHI